MQPDTYYHIFNHANGDENLFREEENYYHFLTLWAKYIEPIADTYAYCQMPNHFHFLVRIKEEKKLLEVFDNSSLKLVLSGFKNLTGLISKQFGNLFNAYAKGYNKMYDRKGSLFIRPFKAKEIDNDKYLTTVVNYIHRNPIHHGFCDNIEDWVHSSYHAYLSEKPSKINRHVMLSLFIDKSDFVDFHRQNHNILDKSLFIDF